MKSILNYPHLGIFILAWFAADLLLPLLIAVSHKLGLLDRPGGHKGQKVPVPYLGGIGIFLAFTMAICSLLRFESIEGFHPLAGIIFGGAVIVTLGLLDDHRHISALVKLFVLFGITVILSAFGICVDLLPQTFFNIPNIIITLFWIVGITSATNSLDNCDGVASGVTAIASFFIFVIAWGSSTDDAQPWLSYLAIGMAGSCLGFLRYNFPPARIYLGDNGSFFLGYMLASMLVFAHYSENPLKAILVPCLVLAVPIFDITLSTLLRIRDGDVRSWKEAVLYCGRDHTAHLLMRVGFSKKRTVAVIYSLAVGGGVAALLVMANDKFSVCFAIAGMYGVLLVAVGILLGRVRQKLGNPLLKRKSGVTA